MNRFAWVICLFLSLSVQAHQNLNIPILPPFGLGVDRLHLMADGIYRGSQPGARSTNAEKNKYEEYLLKTDAESRKLVFSDFLGLKALGVDTVVSFRNRFQNGDLAIVKAEEKMVKTFGMKFVSLPVPTALDIFRGGTLAWLTPKDADVVNTLATLRVLQEQGHTIYMHCMAGKDRTGFISAMFQVYYLGADPLQAEDEWMAIGGDNRELGLILYYSAHGMNANRYRGPAASIGRCEESLGLKSYFTDLKPLLNARERKLDLILQ